MICHQPTSPPSAIRRYSLPGTPMASGELWITDGTRAGTKELTSIGSNYHNGLQPYDITVFGNQLLFNGYDANGNNALWEMSDINAGPQELQNIPGSDTGNFY